MSASTRPTARLVFVAVVLGLCTLGLLARLADLQLVQHSRYDRLATQEHATRDVLPAHRGPILDRNGNPLALSVETYTVQVDPRLWADPATAQKTAGALGAALNKSPQAIEAAVKQGGQRAVSITSGLPYAQGHALQAMALPGVVLSLNSQRIYPEGNLASNILGFVGIDGNGLTGIERDQNSALAGSPGFTTFQRDAFGNPIGSAPIDEQSPQAGSSVTLTIDRGIQQVAEQKLDAAITKSGAGGGTVIAMDPNTGAILAMASRPSFGETTLQLGNAAQARLYRDRAVTDLFEPGSTFKLITMAAAIDSGIVNANTTYDDTGAFRIGPTVIRNWDFSAHGITTMTTVIVDSLNTGAAWVSQQLGAKRFYDYVKRFGFGIPTGVGLSGEASGEVRTPATPGWSTVDLATNAYGQGISVTPLQLVTAVAAIVNGGRLMRPYIVQSVAGPDGVQVTKPTVVRQVISPQTAAAVRKMMNAELQVYLLAQVPGYDGGGKSGTAYIAGANGYASQRTIPSYMEFVPYANPRVLLFVKLDNLNTNALGGVIAAPFARDILAQILPMLDVPPDYDWATGGPPR